MSQNDCSTLRVYQSSVDEIRELVKEEMGEEFFNEKYPKPLKIIVEVIDVSEEYAYEKQFALGIGDEHEEEKLLGIDLSGYSVAVEFGCAKDTIGQRVINLVAQELAKVISFRLKKAVLITKWNEEYASAICTDGEVDNIP